MTNVPTQELGKLRVEIDRIDNQMHAGATDAIAVGEMIFPIRRFAIEAFGHELLGVGRFGVEL